MKLIEKLLKTKNDNDKLTENLSFKVGEIEIEIVVSTLNSDLRIRFTDRRWDIFSLPLKDWEKVKEGIDKLINKEG